MFSKKLSFFSANLCLVIDGDGAFGFEVSAEEPDVSFWGSDGCV